MAYLEVKNKTTDEYRQIFIETYCDHKKPIYTFDNIHVRFFPDMFDHSFYESANWKAKDKSVFSLVRAEKILWIKDALQDNSAKLKIGWDSSSKNYDKSRRVAIVKNNYVVIIWLKNEKEAKFITAFEADNSIGSIMNSPDWTGFKK
ncbi:MAG: hypothetical protein WAV89_08165 [Ignavibacteriaceae bacterium]